MPTKGLLLVNLGSPRAPQRKEVAKYLNEFLMDPYVIDLPTIARWLLVHGIITPFRAEKSAEAYRKIWTDKGSPLVQLTKAFADRVKEDLAERIEVRWCMRYGDPSAESALDGWHVDELYIVPLYPQFAESSTQSALDHIQSTIKKCGLKAKVHVLNDFFAEKEFITAQAERISRHAKTFRPDHILLSFHGLPEHHLNKLHPEHCVQSAECCAQVGPGNRYCYRAQSFATARALTEQLPFAAEKISLGFQSRLGRRPWIKPYTDIVIEELAKSGVRRVVVSCPSFVADCLETLEEIQMRLKDQFLAAGGEALELVPALNDDAEWVRGFVQMIERADLRWET